jgi:hypothetical protein
MYHDKAAELLKSHVPSPAKAQYDYLAYCRAAGRTWDAIADACCGDVMAYIHAIRLQPDGERIIDEVIAGLDAIRATEEPR